MINELCGLGDLERFVETAKFGGMTIKDQMMLCVDILRVLSVMHDENIYHRKGFDNFNIINICRRSHSDEHPAD